MPTTATLRGRTQIPGTTTGTVNPALPAGTAVGDLMVLAIMGASDVSVPAANWGQLLNKIGQEAQGGVWIKTVTAADVTAGNTGAFTMRSSSTVQAQLLVYVGSSYTVTLVGGDRDGIAGTAPTLGARTATVSGINAKTADALIYFVGIRQGAAAATVNRGTLADSNVVTDMSAGALYLETPSAQLTNASVTFSIPASNGALWTVVKVAPVIRSLSDYDNAVLADSPWRYFPLDEAEGQLISDASTNGIAAVIANGAAAAYRQTGPHSGAPAMQFNGQYIQADIDSGITGGNFTAEFWMNPTNLVAGAPKDLFGFNGETRFARSGDAGQALGTVEMALGSTTVNRSTGGVAANNTAQHLVVRYTASTGVVEVFINGASVYTVTQPANGFAATGIWRFLVASLTSVPLRYMTGLFSHLAFYKAALSNARIAAHYAAAVAANQSPTAGFTTTVNDLTVTCQSSSSDPDGSIASYAWTFGDGSTSTAAAPSHTYALPGTYTVTLTVTDNQGATSSPTSHNVTATAPNVAPTPHFTISNTGLTVHLDASGSTDPDGSIVSYQWVFGDNATASGQVVEHTFTDPTVWLIELTVTDNKGATGYTYDHVDLTGAAPPVVTPLVPHYTYTVDGNTITVDASSSEGEIQTFVWNFNNGPDLFGSTRSYTFNGPVHVKLTLIGMDADHTHAVLEDDPTLPGGGGGGETTPDDVWPGVEVTLDDESTYVDDEPRTGIRDAWWYWEAPEDPDAVEMNLLTDDGSQAILGVYTGTNADALTLVTQSATGGDPGAVLTAPESGTTYYLHATVATGLDEDFQLAVAPPADDETYEMDLEVLSGPLRAAPTAVVVTIDGGLPNDDVEFQVDGVLTGDEATLDDSGSLDATSINVADGYAKGDHIVSVHSKTSTLAGEGVFTLQRGPYVDAQTVGRDALAIDIPEASTSTGVRRWVLQDLMPGGLGSWVMPRNPSTMSPPEFQRALTQVHTTAVDEGQYHLASVAHAAIEWTFAGYVESQLEQQKLEAYFALNRRFYVIDHRARAWVVAWRGLELVPRRRQPKDDGTFNDWAADYTVTALIYDQDWRSPT